VKQEFKALLMSTFHRELRSKTLYLLMGFTILLIVLVNLLVNFVFTNVLDESSIKMFGDHSASGVYLVIEFWSTFLCILFGVNAVKADMSSGVIGQVLSFPIQRSTYLFARLLGSSLIVFGYYVVSMLIALVSFSFTSNKMIGGVEILLAMGPSFISAYIIILLGMNLSLYLPRMMAFVSMIFLVGFISISNGFFLAKSWGESLESLGVISSLALVIHSIFPRLGAISESVRKILLGGEVSFNIPFEVTHLVVMLVVWTGVTVLLFKKEDF
jgi:ABC-type transport system involved in multi-copper enzyme maturation permease subunit